jgi:hypothetical protein
MCKWRVKKVLTDGNPEKVDEVLEGVKREVEKVVAEKADNCLPCDNFNCMGSSTAGALEGALEGLKSVDAKRVELVLENVSSTVSADILNDVKSGVEDIKQVIEQVIEKTVTPLEKLSDSLPALYIPPLSIRETIREEKMD